MGAITSEKTPSGTSSSGTLALSIDLDRYSLPRFTCFAVGRLLQRIQFHLQQSLWLRWQATRLLARHAEFQTRGLRAIAPDLMAWEKQKHSQEQRRAAESLVQRLNDAIAELPVCHASEETITEWVAHRYRKMRLDAPVMRWNRHGLDELLPKSPPRQPRAQQSPDAWVQHFTNTLIAFLKSHVTSSFQGWFEKGRLFEAGFCVSDVGHIMEYRRSGREWRDNGPLTESTGAINSEYLHYHDKLTTTVLVARGIGERQPQSRWYHRLKKGFEAGFPTADDTHDLSDLWAQFLSLPHKWSTFSTAMQTVHRRYVDDVQDREKELFCNPVASLTPISERHGLRDRSATSSAGHTPQSVQGETPSTAELPSIKTPYLSVYLHEDSGGFYRAVASHITLGPLLLSGGKRRVFESLLRAKHFGLSMNSAINAWRGDSEEDEETDKNSTQKAISNLRAEINILNLTISKGRGGSPYKIMPLNDLCATAEESPGT